MFFLDNQFSKEKNERNERNYLFEFFLPFFAFSFFLDNSSFSQKLQKCFSFQTIKKNLSLKFTLKTTNFSPFAFFRKLFFLLPFFLHFIIFIWEKIEKPSETKKWSEKHRSPKFKKNRKNKIIHWRWRKI